MKTISIPTNNRLDTLEKVLTSLRAAVGIENWTLVFSCEPCRPVQKWVKELDWMNKYILLNPVPVGCWKNTFSAVSTAMNLGSKLNLYLEDDVIVSPDALTLVDQFSEQGLPGIVCLRRWDHTQGLDPTLVSPASHGLLGDGFAFTPALWPKIQADWFRTDGGGQMWDWALSYGLDQDKIPQWRPLMHRSQNIGTVGTHTAHGVDPNHFSPCYQGTPIDHFQFIP